jgi:hypothetical protein
VFWLLRGRNWSVTASPRIDTAPLWAALSPKGTCGGTAGLSGKVASSSVRLYTADKLLAPHPIARALWARGQTCQRRALLRVNGTEYNTVAPLVPFLI